MGSGVVVYTRVSTLEQTKGVSIETQLDRLQSYAKFREWTIKDEFVDAGWSGKDDNRPGLRRLMTSCRNGDVGTVVVCKIDRLMPNARLLLGCVDEFKKLAIRLKKERLGLVFTDGTIGKDIYETRLHGFRKQEKELLKIKNNLSPEARLEIAELESSIRAIEEILSGS